MGGLFLSACTPTVKEVAIKKRLKDVEVVKKGRFTFTEEEKKFLEIEAKKLGIEVPHRKEIEYHLKRLVRNKKSLEIALRRAKLYIPHIKPILRQYGLPEELALLPFVESRFNPFAVSSSGAGGIWQLMPATARRYGLKVEGFIDERFDLVKSTHAASGYLRDLYSYFKDWELALAAYNCGEGCVRRKTGGKDFWLTKDRLPPQTRNYVPMFFASLLIARSPHKYGLKVDIGDLGLVKVEVKKPTTIREFIAQTGVRESVFRDMNPHIKGFRIPAGSYVYIPQRYYKDIATSKPKRQKPKKVASIKPKKKPKRKKAVWATKKLKPLKVQKKIPDLDVKRKGSVKVVKVKKKSPKPAPRVIVKEKTPRREVVENGRKVILLENGAKVYVIE